MPTKASSEMRKNHLRPQFKSHLQSFSSTLLNSWINIRYNLQRRYIYSPSGLQKNTKDHEWLEIGSYFSSPRDQLEKNKASIEPPLVAQLKHEASLSKA